MTARVQIKKFSFLVALAASAAFSGAARAQPQPVSVARSKTLPVKDPRLATVIGVLIPGGGQLYTSRYGKGLALLLGSAAGVAIAVDASSSHCHLVGSLCHRSGVEAFGIGSAVVLWGYGWATAAHDAWLFNTQRLNRTSFAPFFDWRDGRMIAGLSLRTH